MIEIANMRDGYVEIIDWVLSDGRLVAPRGRRTIELEDAMIKLRDPTDALPVGIGRGVSLSIAAVEAAQLVGGCCEPELMLRIEPRFKEYMDDGRFWGAYGERVGGQLLDVVRKIKADPDTRQAVVTLWRSDRDNVLGKRDYPCTVAMLFRLRDDLLNMSVLMRSNDAWLGLAYDVFVFTQLQQTLAGILNVGPGIYTHHAGSLHVYEDDIPRINQLHPPRTPFHDDLPLGFGYQGQDPYATLMRARKIVRGEPVPRPTMSETWYIKQLEPFINA